MLYNVYIDIGVKRISFLLLSKSDLDRIIEIYQKGVKTFFLRGKTYPTSDINEIQIFTHDKGVFDNDIQFYKQAKLYGFLKSNLLGENYITINGLEFYGENVTEKFIQGEFGYKKTERKDLTPEKQENKDGKYTNQVNSKKIFISHSSIDKDVVESFVNNILKLGLSLSANDIFCTSIEGMNILNGDDFRTKIVDELKECHAAILIITENYKKSEVCLNEMGAIWALGLIRFPLINKPINFKNVGFLTEVQQIGQMCSSSDLDNFMESICEKLKIITPKTATWNSSKEKFLKSKNLLKNDKLTVTKNEIEKTTNTHSSFNSTLKKPLNKSEKNELNSKEILLNSFQLISKTNQIKYVNTEFLNNEIGTFMIWIDYQGDSKLNNHAYIVSHAGNGGVSIVENKFEYENVWAIRRTIVQSNPKKMGWEFFCSDENCNVNSIKSDRLLANGKHLLTISWNRKKKIIKFFIDQKLVGESKFSCWPMFHESKMIIGTWPKYQTHHFIHSKVGMIKVLHGKEITIKELDLEVKSFQ